MNDWMHSSNQSTYRGREMLAPKQGILPVYDSTWDTQKKRQSTDNLEWGGSTDNLEWVGPVWCSGKATRVAGIEYSETECCFILKSNNKKLITSVSSDLCMVQLLLGCGVQHKRGTYSNTNEVCKRGCLYRHEPYNQLQIRLFPVFFSFFVSLSSYKYTDQIDRILRTSSAGMRSYTPAKMAVESTQYWARNSQSKMGTRKHYGLPQPNWSQQRFVRCLVSKSLSDWFVIIYIGHQNFLRFFFNFVLLFESGLETITIFDWPA